MSENNMEVFIPEVMAELEASFASQERLSDNNDLTTWYMKVEGALDADTAEAERYAQEVKRTNAIRKEHLKYRFGPQMRLEADQKLVDEKGSAKSKKMPTGRIGYRSKPARLVITDMAAAIRWVAGNLSLLGVVKEWDVVALVGLVAIHSGVKWDELVLSIKTQPLIDHMKATGELPDGCEMTKGEENFFATPTTLKLGGEE